MTQDVEDIFWIQGQTEGELARRAAEHFASTGVASREQLQDDLERAAEQGDHHRVADLNYDFHYSIAKVVTAQRMRWFLKSAARMSPGRLFPQVEGWTEAAVNDHGAIIEALRSGDGAAAAREMTAYVVHAGLLLADQLTEGTPSH